MTSAAVSETSHLRAAAQPGLRAIRRYWKPFILIQLFGLAFVVLYYTLPGLAGSLEGVAKLKATYGYLFSCIAGIIGGAIVPEVFKVVTIREEKLTEQRLKDLFFSCFYFGLMAMLCDGLYRLLEVIYGKDVSIGTAILKMMSDQFIFTPILGTGIAAIYFPLYRSGWDFQRVLHGFGWNWYLRNVLPILLPAWVYWMPMCLLMYSMPSLLQVPFSVCATAAWGLIITAVASRDSHHHVSEDPMLPPSPHD